MDVLDRIAPVAGSLLARVDAALVAHGAPPGHPIWSSLRQLGTTPGEALTFFAAIDPAPLRETAEALRAQSREYASARLPVQVDWHGTAGEAYAGHVAALAAHLGAGEDAYRDSETMTGRLVATSSYLDQVADWYAGTRVALAGVLAEVLVSTQAVAVRACPALAGGLVDPTTLVGQVPVEVVRAAADIGGHLLAVAAEAYAGGYDLLHRWAGTLAPLPYQPADPMPARRLDANIEVDQR